MDEIDWFNLSSEKAESILPYLLQNLHDNQFVIAAQFLLCQPHLIQHCPNRQRLLEKLDQRYKQNANFGKFVLNRLKWYQMDKAEKLTPSLARKRNSVDFDPTEDGEDKTQRVRDCRTKSEGISIETVLPKGGWVFSSNPLDLGAKSNERRRYVNRGPTRNRNRASLDGLTGFTPSKKRKHSRQISGTELIVQCKYRSVLEQAFIITWNLPVSIVDLLIEWSMDTLAADYDAYGRTYRHLRRNRPFFYDEEQSEQTIDQLFTPNSAITPIIPPSRPGWLPRSPKKEHLKKTKHPLEDWERDILEFLKTKPRASTRDFKLLRELSERDSFHSGTNLDSQVDIKNISITDDQDKADNRRTSSAGIIEWGEIGGESIL